MKKEIKYIFIDVDRTFVRGHSSFGLFKYILKNKGIFYVGIPRLLKVSFFILMNNILFYSRTSLTYSFGKVISGVSSGELQAIIKDYFENELKERIHPYFKEIIRMYKGKKHLILISASLDILLKHFKKNYVDDIICSKLEEKNNRFTGKYIDKPVVGIYKYEAFKEYCYKKGISPLHCAFYSDCHSDYKMLKNVGMPVAFNPDKILYKIAKSNTWKIIQDK